MATVVFLAHPDPDVCAHLAKTIRQCPSASLSAGVGGVDVRTVELEELLDKQTGQLAPAVTGPAVLLVDAAPKRLEAAHELAQHFKDLVVAAVVPEPETACLPPGMAAVLSSVVGVNATVMELEPLLAKAGRHARLDPAEALLLLDRLPLTAFVMSGGLVPTFINQASLGLTGFSSGEILADPERFKDILHPADRELVLTRLGEALYHNHPVNLQCRLMHKSGRVVHALLKAHSLPGHPPRLLGSLVDISGRVLLERSLVQEEKLRTLSRISEEFAHEVRNPLVSIAGFAGRISRLHPESGEEAEIIVNETRRLEALLDRIRDYLVTVRQTRSPCNLGAIMREGLVLLSPELEAKDIWCELAVAPDLPQVTADADILSQTFVHLLLSCLKDAQPGTMLQVRLLEVDAMVQVQLRYNTQNAATLDPDRLLMPFEEGGEGLGVALAYRLIKHMGGLLDFSMEDGTIFTVSLPLTTREGDILLSEHGLPSKRPYRSDADCSFDDLLKREWQLAAHGARPISLLLVDVDHYLSYASLYGREHGERALAKVSDTVREVLRRPGDVVTALSSQLFAALLPDTNQLGAHIVAENIRQAVAGLNILHEGIPREPSAGRATTKEPARESGKTSGRMTVSLGVASMVPPAGISHLDLLADASRALYQAKRRGRNRVHSSDMVFKADSAPE